MWNTCEYKNLTFICFVDFLPTTFIELIFVLSFSYIEELQECVLHSTYEYNQGNQGL